MGNRGAVWVNDAIKMRRQNWGVKVIVLRNIFNFGGELLLFLGTIYTRSNPPNYPKRSLTRRCLCELEAKLNSKITALNIRHHTAVRQGTFFLDALASLDFTLVSKSASR